MMRMLVVFLLLIFASCAHNPSSMVKGATPEAGEIPSGNQNTEKIDADIRAIDGTTANMKAEFAKVPANHFYIEWAKKTSAYS